MRNIKKYQQQWKKEHPDYFKKYRKKHREKLKEYRKKYHKDHYRPVENPKAKFKETFRKKYKKRNQKIKRLRSRGLSCSQIGKKMNISRQRVSKILKKYE